MKTSRLHTLKEVIDNGIWVEPEEESIPAHFEKVSCLYIPKIQRDYAQGRQSESEIRNEFLTEIFDSLKDGKELELSFIFGSKQKRSNNSDGFEILDGQQRLTTLFLLNWYVAMREFELKDRPSLMEKFTYETRDTSSYFLNYITGKDDKLIIQSDKLPSEIIKGRKWFTDEYMCDPTVSAILEMIDSIHIKYNQLRSEIETPIYDLLENLKFYILLLKNFEMSDELYIKMNSRGLSLSPFENFKASIVKFMKSHSEIYDDNFRLEFISKVDAKWIDLFWTYKSTDNQIVNDVIEIDDKEIGWQYITFFNRYFYTKAALNLNGQEGENIINFFYKQATAQPQERLMGWHEYYMPLFEKVPSIFKDIEKFFDEICDNLHKYLPIIRDDKRNYKIFTDFLKNVSDLEKNYNYRIADMVAFATLSEFIETLPVKQLSVSEKDLSENFKRVCRIMFNVVENTLIEGSPAAVSVIRAMSEVVKLPNALTGNVYESLKNNTVKSENRQLKEEKEKASLMFDASGRFVDQWEKSLIKAEQHPFFKGSVGFFIDKNLSDPKDFDYRYDILKDLFDKDGIAENWKKQKKHILIRAILANLNSHNLLKEQRITEKATEKFLKNTIIGSPSIKQMFCNYFQNSKIILEEYFKDFVDKSFPTKDEDENFVRMFNRLVINPDSSDIYDWIASIEKNDKSELFKVQSGPLRINIPSKRSNYLLFNNERRTLLKYIVDSQNLKYSDENAWNQDLKDYTLKQVKTEKTLIDALNNKVILLMEFDEWGQIFFKLPLSFKEILLDKNKIKTEQIKTENIEYAKLTYIHDNAVNRKKISDMIDEIEKLISSISFSREAVSNPLLCIQ